MNAGISTSYFENLKSDNAPEGFKDQFKNNRGEYVSFSLSFPLFDGLSRLTNARRYRNNMRIARETRTEVFRQLQTAVEQSVLDREGYAKEAIQMDKKVKSDELAYRVTHTEVRGRPDEHAGCTDKCEYAVGVQGQSASKAIDVLIEKQAGGLL